MYSTKPASMPGVASKPVTGGNLPSFPPPGQPTIQNPNGGLPVSGRAPMPAPMPMPGGMRPPMQGAMAGGPKPAPMPMPMPGGRPGPADMRSRLADALSSYRPMR